MNDKSRITTWLNPAAFTESKYGNVSNGEWLKRECERINNGGGHTCRVVTNSHDGYQAVCYTNGWFENGAWVEARPEHCGEPKNVVQQAKGCQPVLA